VFNGSSLSVAAAVGVSRDRFAAVDIIDRHSDWRSTAEAKASIGPEQ
jgi:hypothetical protein